MAKKEKSKYWVSEERIHRREVSLAMDGFNNDEIAILKYTRLTPHKTDEGGYSSTVYNLRRRRRRLVARLAVDKGLDPRDPIGFRKAAELYRRMVDKDVEDWRQTYTGLPPEYDPIVLMGYAKYA